jgi:hypothetical protein
MTLKDYPGVLRLGEGWEPVGDGTWKRELLIYVDRPLDTLGNDPWLAELQATIQKSIAGLTFDRATVIAPNSDLDS